MYLVLISLQIVKLVRIINVGEDQSNQEEVEACKIMLTEDLATIIYTSGTTGKPKV
jgi:long-chain acyl-CoA synthetase